MQALKETPDRQFSSVTLHLLDDNMIASVNNTVFQRNKPTDVISLTYDGIPGEDSALEGELFVNTERALQLSGSPLPLEQELALYIAHGCDHLAGSEDDTDEKKERMLNRNNAWVQGACDEGLLQGLVD